MNYKESFKIAYAFYTKVAGMEPWPAVYSAHKDAIRYSEDIWG